ncbi:MAG: urate hydroxylase PuuD [Caulobacteraceae bacterium]|nr:urate hydroxylase PuuD [Caulobacteraceae bacterium]
MAGLLQNFRNTMIVSVLLAVVMIFSFGQAAPGHMDMAFWQAVARWGHTFFGILWIGLLYYFNFVQIRKMPDIPAELKPAISKYIAPEALFWFRWAAAFTVLFGLIVAWLKGGHAYLAELITFGFAGGYDSSQASFVLMGVGVWLAFIMAFNVWFVIWPNQKVALGIVEADADAKAKAARTAMLFSRINVLLSLPMLTAMTMYQTLFG